MTAPATTKPARKPISELNRLFLDVETSGLDPYGPEASEIIEIAWVLTDPTGERVLAEREYKVFPEREVPEEAAKINGYDKALWDKEAIHLDEALYALACDSNGALFVAHNATFDWAFINKALRDNERKWAGDYHRACTMAMSLPLAHAGEVKGVSLKVLAEHFGIPQKAAHTALSDARTCWQIYLRLMDAYLGDPSTALQRANEAFYRETVRQRDAAWREVERLQKLVDYLGGVPK